MKYILWSIAILASILLTACQPKDNPTDGKDNLVIALDWVPNTNHTGLYVALDKGFFAQQGLAVDIVQPSEDSSSVLVSSKRADLGVYFQPNMIKRLKKGEPITAIAAIAQNNSAGLMSLKSLGAKTPKDLHGMRYSTWEDPIDDAVVATLVGEPLVKIPNETTDAATALRLNQFDYIIAYYGWDNINAKLKGLQTDFFYLKDENPVFNYYFPLLIANNEALQKNPQKYKKALKAIKEGYIYAAHHPKESADILQKYAPEINAELAQASQAYLSTLYLDDNGDWGKFDYERWDKFFAWVYEQKLIDTPFDKKAGVSNDYLPD